MRLKIKINFNDKNKIKNKEVENLISECIGYESCCYYEHKNPRKWWKRCREFSSSTAESEAWYEPLFIIIPISNFNN